ARFRPPREQTMSEVRELAIQARAAGRRLSALERAPKDAALHAIAQRLRACSVEVGEINARAVEAARAAGLSAPMIQRLQMGADVVEATAQGVEFVASLADPVGSRAAMQRLPNGLLIGKQRIPLGVIAMIYESRPNVTVDAAVLCLKAGNACLLRGGKEAQHTNRYLGELIQAVLAEAGLPAAAVQIVPATDRAGIAELVSLTGLI